MLHTEKLASVSVESLLNPDLDPSDEINSVTYI